MGPAPPPTLVRPGPYRRLGADGGLARRLAAYGVEILGPPPSLDELAECSVELLESVAAPADELARTYATLAQRVGDEPVVVHALTTLAITEIYLGRDAGWAKLEESFRRADAAGLQEDAARALVNLVEAASDLKRFDLVDRHRDEAIASRTAGRRRFLAASRRSARPVRPGSRYRAAASAWEAVGCPYQQALALADSEAEEDLRSALDIFQSLGARPAAGLVAERLRALGVRKIPRGPRPRTQLNPAGLTSRELEVLSLLGQGLRNVDIAGRLVVSPKTVDHHVSAILGKLRVPTRAAAAEEAVRLGFKDGESVAPK